jgi:acyl-CoA synthetase (AMP-forming)/AMP-acid ligase II
MTDFAPFLGTADDTMVRRLFGHAERQPDRLAYAFVPELETAATARLSYGELAVAAGEFAAGLEDWFAARPDQPRMALLLFPAGLEFLVAFWGCLMARTIAIPAAMPRPGRPAPIVEAIARNSGVHLVVTRTQQADAIRQVLAASPVLSGLALEIDAVLAAAGRGRSLPNPPSAQDIAFLQYTSGSTSMPKGVVVRHGNLLANERMISEGMATDHETDCVSWLPHYHDMGLIGSLLHPLYSGASCHTMAPTTFLKRPLRWLRTISQERGRAAGSPDFGYRLCVDRVSAEQVASLDLSSWQVAFSGAEPLRADTFERFAAHFAPAGFRPGAAYPCYGMAEATLFAAGSLAGGGPVVRPISASALASGRAESPAPGETPRRAVSSGQSFLGGSIAIVDPDSRRRLPDGMVGEIWLAGPHVADGYFNDPQRTADTFQARIADAAPEDRGYWLRTGDLGFLCERELFVTGRLKDLLIVNGRNLYPHDVEDVLRKEVEGVRDAALFALPVNDGSEHVVGVLELATSHRRLILGSDGGANSSSAVIDLARTARLAVARDCELAIDHVRFVLPGGIPKTTSGKTRYGQLREEFHALGPIARQSPLSTECFSAQENDR